MTISEANYRNTKPGHTRELRWRGKGYDFIYESESKPRPPGPEPPHTFRYYVFRTCANGACGLKRRSGPSTSFPKIGAPLLDRTAVDIVCQTRGARVFGLDASSTDVWDRLDDGSFVSDYFVNTEGKRDQFTVPIPDCTALDASAAAAPPPPSVALAAPPADEVLTGTVEVNAISNAPSVRFEALYSTTPGIRGSANWHVLGTDSSPADGFHVAWETKGVPNQGLANQETIQIAATALDADGGVTSARDARQVAVANANSDGSFTYHVYNTCESPKCELNRRSGPGFSDYPIVGATKDGGEVHVVCQAHGQVVNGAQGASDVWDQFTDGSWGSDYYVDTPLVGELSPPIPECQDVPPAPTLEVELVDPEAGATVTGNVLVEATGTAPGVRFEAFYSMTPEDGGTATWVLLGQDNSPGDGYSVGWDTTEVPNQGLPSLNTVNVRAIALNFRGDTTSVQSIHRVSISNPSEDGTFRYHVFGTCANGGDCKVELYSGPGYSSFSVVGSKKEDDAVDIACQAHGETFTATQSSDVWNKLSNGAWVTDYFVDTPTAGAFSPPIPVCE